MGLLAGSSALLDSFLAPLSKRQVSENEKGQRGMSQDSCDDEPPLQPTIEEYLQEQIPKNPQHVLADQQLKRPAVDLSVAQPFAQQDQWNKENNYSERQLCVSKWLNGITIVSAVLAGIALIFLWVQINMMKTSLQTTERAWITIKGVTLGKGMVAGEEIPLSAGFQNSGHSPALHVTVKHLVAISSTLPFEAKLNFPNSPPTQSLAVLGPDSKMMSHVQHSVTIEDMNNLIAQKAYLYSFGIIEYVDIFDANHWTTFCYRSKSLSDLNLVACSGWNDMDKN